MLSAEDYFNRGIAKIEKGDWAGAIADFDRAIKLKPDYAKAYVNRGIAKIEKGDWAGAITDYDSANKLKPDYAEAYVNRGIAKIEKGDWAGAIADFDRANKLKPDYAEAYVNRGIAKIEKGDWAGAIADFDRAIKLKPDYAKAYVNRGIAKSMQDEQASAIADYNKAIKLKPDYAEAYVNRGNAKSMQGKQASAIADFDRAIKLKPDYAEAYFNRGNAKIKKDDWAGAIADYDRAIKLKPDYADVYFNRGTARSRRSEHASAIDDFDRVLELKPGDAEAYINRGNAKIKKGDWAGAIADYDQANILDLDIWFRFPQALIALRSQHLDELERTKLFKLNLNIDNLLKAFTGKQSRWPRMHYTNLDALRNLAEGGKFRLYNSMNTDDSKEGSIMFDWLDEVFPEDKEQRRKKFILDPPSKIYIVSYVTDSDPKEGDDMMWRTYGKHNGQERAGCALVFRKDQFCKNRFTPFRSAQMKMFVSTGYAKRDKGASEVEFKECYLYPVCYDKNKVTEPLKELGKTLSCLCERDDAKMSELIAFMLDRIRFLFKRKIYKRENEMRLIIWREGQPRKTRPGEIKPRIKEEGISWYIEWPLEMKEVKVLLGPATRRKDEWKEYLDGKDAFASVEIPD